MFKERLDIYCESSKNIKAVYFGDNELVINKLTMLVPERVQPKELGEKTFQVFCPEEKVLQAPCHEYDLPFDFLIYANRYDLVNSLHQSGVQVNVQRTGTAAL